MTLTSYNFAINRLEKSGFKSYIVGGFVRDFLMERKSYDIDIATEANPKQIKEIFKDCKLETYGEKYKSIRVITNSFIYEITTFRKDQDYFDKRHPKSVKIETNILEDLKRRDFTMNSIAFRNGEIIDPYEGIKDIKEKKVVAVLDAKKKISEDFLRALRAIRFCASLNFKLDKDLYFAIKLYSLNIKKISKERIQSELNKMLLSDRADIAVELLRKTNLFEHIFPQMKNFSLSKYLDKNKEKYELMLKELRYAKKDLITRLCLIYFDFFKEIKLNDLIIYNLSNLKYNKKIISPVLKILNHEEKEYSKNYIRFSLVKLGEDDFRRFLDIKNAKYKSLYFKDNEEILRFIKDIEYVKNDDIPLTLNDLNINGFDIINLGIPKGKKVGEILNIIFNLVQNEKLKNEKEVIITFIKRFLDEKEQ
ncbi:MAG: CCA tRNA nucleotidyltransferase [Peptoniphilaceae bacterium]|nr:CCA tRNA nucleotidyltransferase [Peptoniphilaceae bacterium]MDY3738094.1 CCA tRNA nucleotidyltransferase [Peptoniphilaceae bacterium]